MAAESMTPEEYRARYGCFGCRNLVTWPARRYAEPSDEELINWSCVKNHFYLEGNDLADESKVFNVLDLGQTCPDYEREAGR